MRAFARRGDVLVVDNYFSPAGADGAALADFPPDAAAFLREHAEVELTWVLAEEAAHREQYKKGAEGGRLNLGIGGGWNPRSGWEWVEFDEWASLDNMAEEAGTWFVTRDGGPRTGAEILFHPSSDPEDVRTFPTFEAYLTLGASKAFAWYWQKQDHESAGILRRLRARSVAATTPPAELARALQGRGIEAEDAEGLVAWLGADAVLLLDTPSPSI
jgi:hypothetical protein